MLYQISKECFFLHLPCNISILLKISRIYSIDVLFIYFEIGDMEKF